MSEETTVTALDLLNLALGTPEIGAVNFNLLHRFLLELVKHFSLARKQIDITDDIAIQTALEETRLSSGISQSRLYELGDLNIDEVEEKEQTSGVKSKDSVGTFSEKVEDLPVVTTSNERVDTASDVKADSGVATAMSAKIKTPSPVPPSVPKSKTPSPVPPSVSKRKTQSPRLRSAVSDVASKPETSTGVSRTDVRRRSFEQISTTNIYQLERKISILSAKIDALDAAPSNLEIAQQARDLQRAGSSISTTAAGDMWQTMNVVRRLEVAEGAINGITSMLDDISQQLKTMKDDNTFEQRLDELSNVMKNVTASLERPVTVSVARDETPQIIPDIDPQKTPVVADQNQKLQLLETKLSEYDNKIKEMVSKNELLPFLTAESINDLVDNKILNKMTSVATPHLAESTAEKTEQADKTGESSDQKFETNNDTAILQELSSKIHGLGEFRGEILRTIDEIKESLGNTVEKSALNDIKVELSKATKSHQATNVNQPTQKSASLTDFQELKNNSEVKIQSLEKELEELRKNFFQFCDMQESVTDLVESGEVLKSNLENLRKEVGKILKEVDEKLDSRASFAQPTTRKHSFNISEDQEFHLMRVNVVNLKDGLGKLESVVGEILDDQNKKQLHLDALYGHIDRLDDKKADKKQVIVDLEQKADKKALHAMVSQDFFSNSISGLDQSVQDLMQKFDGHETSLRQAISHITADVNSKLDKVALDPVKDYLQEKLQDLQTKLGKKTAEEINSAAGTRCLLLQNANCISCDKPVNLFQENKLPSLPYGKTFPGTQSFRPFTTFELDGVRREKILPNDSSAKKVESFGQSNVQKELIKLGAIKASEDLPVLPERPCGGNHTLTCAEKRTTIRFNKAYREDLHFIAQLTQKDFSIVDILGYDGHVYKGHVTQLPAIPELSGNVLGRRSSAGAGPPRASSPL